VIESRRVKGKCAYKKVKSKGRDENILNLEMILVMVQTGENSSNKMIGKSGKERDPNKVNSIC
jgi:hypothetical protein